MPNTVILTSQPAAALSAVPNQNTTLTVAASANFSVAAYTYQWRDNGTPISGATSSSYFFEPSVASNHNHTYTCLVSGLSATSTGNVAQTSIISTGVIFGVFAADTGKFFKWTPKDSDPNQLKESGEERFKRMRNLGYC